MKIITDNSHNRAIAGQPFILTADSLSGPRTANSRTVATFRQTAEKCCQTVEPFYQAAHADLNNAIAASKTNARLLAQRIKKSTAYTEVIGKQLNIIGAEDTTDMTQAQPTLFANVKAGGVVEIDFNKMDAEGVHIYGMRDGETVFSYLASETHAAYVDNRPLLVAGKPETRQYKAVFFIGKSEIGLPSAVVIAIAAP
jgi:hypothetical protein